MIDKTKLPYKYGDFISCESTVRIEGIIIGYFFTGGFNNYEKAYGYIIKLIKSEVIGHSVGSYTYDNSGNKLYIYDIGGYWYVYPDKAKLIRHSLQFLLRC